MNRGRVERNRKRAHILPVTRADLPSEFCFSAHKHTLVQHTNHCCYGEIRRRYSPFALLLASSKHIQDSILHVARTGQQERLQ